VDDLELSLSLLLERGDREQAMTLAWRGYGPELLGYLASILHDEEDAREVLAQVSERLWKGLGGFRGESTFRGWAYRVAWTSALLYLRRRGRRRERRLDTTEGDELLPMRAREATPPHRQTTVRDRVAALRLRLEPEEQTLLTLRVDRGLSWAEIAHVLSDEEQGRLEEPALRKRFERVKRKLRDLALAEGLLATEER
jgi:RNA polymerase sigma-70 factor, ECF subfamily